MDDNPKIDTILVRDTIVSEIAKEVAIPNGYELVATTTLKNYDEVLAAYKDSLERKPVLVTVHDTAYIAVPINEYTFTDDKTYAAVLSGYDVKMLRHESYQETAFITRPVPYLPKISFSPVLSAFGTKDIFFTGAGAEVEIRGGKWALRPSLGYGLNHNGQNWGHGPYLRLDATYNLYSK